MVFEFFEIAFSVQQTLISTIEKPQFPQQISKIFGSFKLIKIKKIITGNTSWETHNCSAC
jgi:hypothetical protein